MDWLKNEEPQANIIFIDFRLLTFEHLKDYHQLNSFIEQHYQENVSNYLCIDEVQMCERFELAINSLHASEKYVYDFVTLISPVPCSRIRHIFFMGSHLLE